MALPRKRTWVVGSGTLLQRAMQGLARGVRSWDGNVHFVENAATHFVVVNRYTVQVDVDALSLSACRSWDLKPLSLDSQL